MAAFPQPPVFGVMQNSAVPGQDDKVARPGLISIVDIFDDFLFSTSDKNLEINPPSDQNNNNSFSKDDDYDYDSHDDESDEDKPRKRARGNNKSMTEEQKVERR